jgi:glycosyltransferase involved in cell wall biosynthesis
MPKVSIIMNCYNGERYLQAAIDSIFAQTFTDWELVFWDNASTDNSANIVKAYGDRRIRYFRGERNVPLGEARKLAMEQVTGEWIGFLDTDDLWYPQKLTRQIAALSDDSHIVCYSGIDEIRPDGTLIRTISPLYATGWMFEHQLMQYDINMVSPLIKRKVLDEHILMFNPEVTASEEYNLFLRVIVHGSVAAIEEPLAAMRIGAGTLTDRQMYRWADERMLTLRQLEDENPGISERYPRAFLVAHARAEYYRARYFMSEGRTAEARDALRKVVSVDVAYRVMFCLTFSRLLWGLAHSTTLKRKWLPRIWSWVAPR